VIMNVEFRELKQTQNKEFDEAMELYLKAFPANERHPIEVITERVRAGLSQLYVGSLGDEVIFMALLWPLRATDFVLLDYIATKDNYRSKGIASAFLEQMKTKLRSLDKYFILEVESPETAGNKVEKENRIAFYKRQGAKEMQGIRYILPPLHGTVPTEMILMLFPDYQHEEIDGSIVKKIVTQIYQELYNRDANDALLRSFVGDIGSTIKLR
jgi:GNAT superfamily N-acetyltransferase